MIAECKQTNIIDHRQHTDSYSMNVCPPGTSWESGSILKKDEALASNVK